MHKPRRIKITDLNPNLICVLCGGYYVDATTIIECLHSFCKACIVRYLETNRYCPICDVQVHKTKPLQNIRADKTLQDIVYKLVPGLFQNEMRCRREFYAKHPEAQPTSQIDAGDVTDHAYFYAADEAISLSLEYYHSEECSQQKFPCSTRRYFRCPAAVTVAHLQKLIRAKFGLTAGYRVDIIYMDKILNEEFTLMDIAYIYRWRRKTPLDLTYRIFECCWSSNKRMKLEHNPDPAVKDEEETSGKEEKMEVDGMLETNAKVETEIEENNSGGAETWKEVQLQISENGVMSVTDISTSSQSEANNNTLENCITEGSYCLKTKYMENDKVLKTEVIKDIKDSVAEETQSTPATASPTLTTTTSSISLATTSATSTSMAVTITGTALQNWPKKQEQQKASLGVVAPTSFTEMENTKPSITESAKQNHSPVVNQHTLPSVVTSSGSSTITTTTPVPSLASQHKNDLSVFTKRPVEINKNVKKQQLLQSQPLALKVSSAVTAPTVKVKDSITNNVTPKRDPLKTAVVAPTQSMLTNSTASRKPLTSSGSSAPVGYKTLKTPPKSWNQSITRLSFLSSAKNHTYATNTPSSVCENKGNDLLGRQQGETAMTGGPNKQQGHSTAIPTAGAPASPTKPNRFFKMRMPRYLGNPASGVKPMYQVATSISKQDLASQAASQIQSSSKPLYQMATSPHNVTPAHSSSGGQKLPYSSGNPTQAHLHSMMAFPMGMQQTNKMEPCSPTSSAKHFPLPAMNQQMRDCSSSAAHLLSQSLDIKPIYTNSNQLQDKHQDGGNTGPPTSYTTSTPKSAAAVSVPSNSSLTSTSKSKNSSMNKQECMPQNGKSKPELISPPTSKHNNITLMKIDPKTLSPIVVGANSAPNTPPLPHSPSPPSPMTPQNLKSRSQPFPLPAHSNSNKGSPPLGSPFLPNLLYPSFPFPGMVGGNRMGAGPPPLVRAPGGMGLGAYHPLPPSINMLFNPHHRTHTHNSPNSGSQSPSLIPPPAVQRIPASGAHHKNSPSPTGILNKPSPAHSPSPLPQPAKAHMTSRSTCNISQTVSGPAPRQSAEGESAERGLQKTASLEVARTVNGEQNDGETNRTVDNSGNQGSNSKVSNNNSGDGNSSGDGEHSSTSASEQGISNVNNFITENKVATSSGENGQASDTKNENSDVTHNQSNQKQEINETGNNKEEESKKNAAEESKTQMEKT